MAAAAEPAAAGRSGGGAAAGAGRGHHNTQSSVAWLQDIEEKIAEKEAEKETITSGWPSAAAAPKLSLDRHEIKRDLYVILKYM